MAVKYLRTESYALDDLRPHPQNPNRGAVDEIATSLEEFDQYRSIVVNQDLTILAGHHVWRAAQQLDRGEIRCDVVEADADESLRILLADNRLAEKGEGYDLDRLLSALESTENLAGTGFDDEFLGALQESLGGPPSLDDLEDEAGPVQEDDYHSRITLQLVPAVAEAWAKHRKASSNDSAALGKLLAGVGKLDRAAFNDD